MAAGLGYKEFATGDVLTAADANGYLASQVVMVFASAAARTSAIASPQEGMISFLKDTNSTEYYSGSAWVAIGGGGSAGALVYITGASPSASSAVNINNCFTSTYQNYLIVFNLLGSTATNLSMRLRNAGTDVTSSNYSYMGQSIQPNGTSGAWNNSNGTKWDVNDLATVKTTGTITMMNPQETNYTTAQVNTTRLTNGTTGRFITQGFTNNASLSSDGFSIFPDSGTCTGTVRVYGIANS